ncbi:MFS transporter [Photobacterium iliopiscarium]|jgi:MFS family permease|uniref:MFS transporter n=1 Tax=Photobacterium iliopiscarium TaxID=56192 RepID=A0A0D8Q2C4_9GAMM|nr:MFS transporter [Photobacterium iliopiscarium]KJG24327.1 MFS transporter [Photobacterium iliopiscarium]PST95857.1 MFS transporter [Photobacterium iliopiscarium]PST99195.1 MFS transporter [Photobacterium iliopiscarium]PSV85032.1 MFS transporter [Photobacterium iliopiscarium]PSV94031.1 MFS transporter [Photobacterium iliopiscarium]
MNQKIEIQPQNTIQNYIDGISISNPVSSKYSMSMTRVQWRIWLLATFGKFFEGMIVFMMGLTLPLLTLQFHLTELQKGIISSSILFGILIGASALGGLSDLYGRKKMFIIEMALLSICLIGMATSQSYLSLLVFNFGIGLALGCDYPTAHLMISESIPSKNRGKLVLGAFAFQSIGVLFGILTGIFVLTYVNDINAWRLMYIIALIPSLAITVARFFIPESAHWLLSKNRKADAETSLKRLLHRSQQSSMPIMETPCDEVELTSWLHGYKRLFKEKYRAKTILASVPWFIQDLGTYGIGIFTPVILASVLDPHKATGGDALHNTIANTIYLAKGTAVIDCLLIVGVICAIIFSESVGRMKLQIYGFIGCSVGLLCAAVSVKMHGDYQMYMLFLGFMLFNFMNNLGPNAQTYLISGEVFPVKIRAKGAGFAASIAKFGAILTAFLFPILLHGIGVFTLLLCLVVTSLLGAWVTHKYRFETSGRNIESM